MNKLTCKYEFILCINTAYSILVYIENFHFEKRDTKTCTVLSFTNIHWNGMDILKRVERKYGMDILKRVERKCNFHVTHQY